MILDHLDWTWPGGRIFIFWSWLPWIVVKDDDFWATVQWPSPLCLEVHRRKVHTLDTWRCKINVAFLESKCPGKSARNATSTVFSHQKSTGESTGRFLVPFSPSTPRISSQASPIRCRRKRLGTPRFQRLSGNVLWSLMEDWRWWAMAAKIRGYLGFFWMFVQRLFSQCFFKCQSKKPHWIPYWCQLLGQL